MTAAPAVRACTATAREALARPPGQAVALHWLGQAGFVVDGAGTRLVVDPYLSDTLAEKYRGTATPHDRLMPPPLAPAALKHVDAVLCTHAHTDHMDPGTLGPLLAANPAARLLAPEAELAAARTRAGVDPGRILPMVAGRAVRIGAAEVHATPAAHEAPRTDAEGRHHFLGYALRLAGLCLWHSGDCIPFDGLLPAVRPLAPAVALLPVNGRGAHLARHGIPGNFTLDEAIDVARSLGCAALVAHHYGMFAFNTVPAAAIDAASARTRDLQLLRARPDQRLLPSPPGATAAPRLR